MKSPSDSLKFGLKLQLSGASLLRAMTYKPTALKHLQLTFQILDLTP